MSRKKGYPLSICGPLLRPKHGEYNENELENITINKKSYKIDKYGNVCGYKNCIFTFDSCGELEEIGIWDAENYRIIEYEFGYSYF